ncbi:MAG: DUF434 domain-containing protein [Bacteroidales bacterium]|nr:DUF434 domain-containing protein [Bacteroidales bacterium]
MNNLFHSEHFQAAAEDYLLFLDKGYPQQSIIRIVGDRYRLRRDQRQVLFRGICPTAVAARRRVRIGLPGEGDLVLVDTYNVLFTICNYFLGKQLFIGNDGFLRDIGEMRGRIKNKEMFSRSEKLMIDTFKNWKGVVFRLFLDEPVPYSGRFAIKLSKTMAEEEIEGDALTVHSADFQLKNERSTAICTSDSAIIDSYEGKVIDVPHYILRYHFGAEFPVLSF